MASLTHTPNLAADRILATWRNLNASPVCPVTVGDWTTLHQLIQHGVSRPVPVLVDPEQHDVLFGWCEANLDLETVVHGLASHLAERAGRNSLRLQEVIDDANDFFVRRLLRDANVSWDSVRGRIFRMLLNTARQHHGHYANADLLKLISEFVTGEGGGSENALSTMKILLDFVDPSVHPVLLCSFTDLQSAQSIQSLVLHDSRIRVVFAFSRAAYKNLSDQPDSFFKATLQQLVLHLETDDFSLTPRSSDGSEDDPGGQQHWRQFLSLLPTGDELVHAAERHLHLSACVDNQQAADRARSAAEAFLFQVISSHPKVEHKFELNRVVDFRFGTRNAEIDLACAELKIAIEVDGYFHFRDDESYRRDRRKDVLLQRHGYHVLRFLANDVVPHIDSILHTVMDAITFRDQQTAEHELTSNRKPK